MARGMPSPTGLSCIGFVITALGSPALALLSFVLSPYERHRSVVVCEPLQTPSAEPLVRHRSFQGRDILSMYHVSALRNSSPLLVVAVGISHCHRRAASAAGRRPAAAGSDEALIALQRSGSFAFPALPLGFMITAISSLVPATPSSPSASSTSPRLRPVSARAGALVHLAREYILAPPGAAGKVPTPHHCPSTSLPKQSLRSCWFQARSQVSRSAFPGEAGLSYLGLGAQPPMPFLGGACCSTPDAR